MTGRVGLRVVTANAASGRDRRTGRIDLVPWARAVAELDADVVGVQEVDRGLERSGGVDQTAALAAACSAEGGSWTGRFAAAVHGQPGGPAAVEPAVSSEGDRASYGVALVCRHPADGWAERRLSPSRARLPVPLQPGAGRRVLWVPDEPRVALAARVRVPGGPVSVVVAHLSFMPVRAAAQLREVAAWVRALPLPVVLLGDLNLPGGWPARLTGLRPLAARRTFPADRPVAQLDHVLLHDPAGRVRVAGVADRVLAGSDHRALVVDLVLRGGAGG